MQFPRRWLQTLRRYVAALAIVAGSTMVAEFLYRVTGSTRLSMVFLAGVLFSGYLLGSGPAYFAAAIAFGVYNFYLVDPPFTFSLGTSEDLITLLVFVVVAMLTGNLTGRVRNQAARAQAQAQTTTILFEATRDLSSSVEEEPLRHRLAEHLSRAAGGVAAVLDGTIHVHPSGHDVPDTLMHRLQERGRPQPVSAAETERIGGWWVRPLHAGSANLGMAVWRPQDPGAASAAGGDDDERLLDILVDVGAAAIQRARLAGAKARAEALAQTEQTRNALLSSISHDMRTPLSAILVSVTSLRKYRDAFDGQTRDDLAATIQEEAERLNTFVRNLLNMTRLEAGGLNVKAIAFNVPEAIERAVGARGGGSVRTVIEAGLPEAAGDPLLFEQALGNVLENAMRYAEGGDAVEVCARAEADRIVIDVADCGPGVPAGELERIFEKFFRSAATAGQPGTGLGLAIARGLLEAMDGRIEALNRDDAPSGLRVRLQIPVTG